MQLRIGLRSRMLECQSIRFCSFARCAMIHSLLSLVLAAPPTELPVAPPPRPAGLGLLPGEDPSLADWTPRPALGQHEPWERATDKDWIDPRFREMNTVPVLNCTMRFPFDKGQV